MTLVDEALEWADQISDDAPGTTHEAILAAEVRSLRAMLEPTPDARELAMKILATFSEAATPGYRFIPMPDIQPGLDGAAQLIAAHDARLLDEAAEKAKVYCKSYGFTFMVDQFLTGLDAAIKGAAHE